MHNKTLVGVVVIAVIFVALAGLITESMGSAIAASHTDVAIGASGWILTAAGFAITLWQLQQTRSSADSAREAVSEVRRDIKKYDAVVEITRAQNALEGLRELHQQRRWQLVHDRYQSVKHAFTSVVAMYGELSHKQRQALEAATDRLTSMDRTVEQHVHNGTAEPNVADFNIAITELTDDLHAVSLEIKKDIGHNG